MGHQGQFSRASVIAKGAMVASLFFIRDCHFGFLQVGEENGGNFVTLVGYMKLHLVHAVGVIVASIAPQLNWIGDIQELKLPLIGRAPFFDMVHVIQALEMFVGFAVELKVGLEIGLVLTELANEVSSNDN